MKRCPKCKKNRVSIGRELCDSCHHYQTHSEGIEKQWEKVRDSRSDEFEPDDPLPPKTPWRRLFGLALIVLSIVLALELLISIPSDLSFAETRRESWCTTAAIKGNPCPTEEEVRDSILDQRWRELTGPLGGFLLGGYFFLFDAGEWRFRRKQKV